MAITDADRSALNAALDGLDIVYTVLGVAASAPFSSVDAIGQMTRAKVTTTALRMWAASLDADTTNPPPAPSLSLANALASVQIKG